MLRRGGRLLPSTRRALIFLPLWLAASVKMIYWWLFSVFVNNETLYVILSVALFYETILLPSLLLYCTVRAKVPAKRRPEKNKKVAIITPCVPAQESLDIIESQLIAMKNVTYPHDSWILDEGNQKAIKQLAKKYGVKYFSRKGVKKYNQANYPFMAKTKAGNVNAWLEHTKRSGYEFFVQMDVDHHPLPEYLDKTIGHFRDPQVGWCRHLLFITIRRSGRHVVRANKTWACRDHYKWASMA